MERESSQVGPRPRGMLFLEAYQLYFWAIRYPCPSSGPDSDSLPRVPVCSKRFIRGSLVFSLALINASIPVTTTGKLLTMTTNLLYRTYTGSTLMH